MRTVTMMLSLAAGLAAGTPGPVLAETDTKAETIFWCIHQVGEYGSEAVDVCVKEELAAIDALAKYPPEAQETVRLCEKRAGGRGLGAVRYCVDRDLEADAALSTYPDAHRPIVDRCRETFAQAGAHRVRQCVDEEIAHAR
ncbi:MAG: hypothetical protein GC151_15055 [Betaproteobacteria bacterium]|nr:hypothetical protein [Betaproteobacteria bacterium]